MHKAITHFLGVCFTLSKANAKPPEKGSFPLDHFHECKTFMEKYMACLKRESNSHANCREETKAYVCHALLAVCKYRAHTFALQCILYDCEPHALVSPCQN